MRLRLSIEIFIILAFTDFVCLLEIWWALKPLGLQMPRPPALTALWFFMLNINIYHRFISFLTAFAINYTTKKKKKNKKKTKKKKRKKKKKKKKTHRTNGPVTDLRLFYSEQAYVSILKNKTYGYVPVQFEKPLVFVSYSNLVRPVPSSLTQEVFFKNFPNMSLCKTNDPWGESIFWPQGCNVNNLGKGLLDKTKYHMPKAWAF